MTIDKLNTIRDMEYTYNLMVKRESAKEIRLFQLGNYLIERWEKIYQDVVKINLNLLKKEAKGRIFGASVLQISALFVSILLVLQINGNNLTIGDYVALMSAVLMVQSTFGTIGMSVGSIFEAGLYIHHYFQVLDLQDNLEKSAGVQEYPKGKFRKLKVENVSFKFPRQQFNILNNISFTLNRGETLAIIGENGAGKSTLINCILGLYPITEGKILIDDINIENINIKSMYSNTAAIFQDFNRYKYTVRDNVGFGDVNNITNLTEILLAIDKVGLSEKVNSLDMKENTRLGKEFEGGIEFSGGQWQRLALSRALYKKGELIILDEPTASLDPKAELEIFELFKKITEESTSIIISHRLGITRFADRIIVLSKGTIIEIGTHEELLKQKGVYSDMYQKQMEMYYS